MKRQLSVSAAIAMLFMRHQRNGADDSQRCEDNLQAIHTL